MDEQRNNQIPPVINPTQTDYSTAQDVKSNKFKLIVVVSLFLVGLSIASVSTALVINLINEGNADNGVATQDQDEASAEKESSATEQDVAEVVAYPANTNPTEIDLTENDKIRVSYLELAGLDVLVVMAKLDLNFPQSAEEASLIHEVSQKPWIDPASGELYKFVETPPKAGEIQFVPGGSCQNSYREVEYDVGSPSSFWAMALLLDDGSIVCQSNVGSS